MVAAENQLAVIPRYLRFPVWKRLMEVIPAFWLAI